MRPLRASRAFARARAPAPAPAQSQGTFGLVLDTLGHCISILITLASIPRVWKLSQIAITVDNSLLMPLLNIPSDHLAARRAQSWLFVSTFHSLTFILLKYKVFLSEEKDYWILLFLCSSHLFALIVSVVLFAILLRRYPISEVLCIISIGFGIIGYLLVVLTDMTYLEMSTVTLEIILIPITIWMQTLRFASQDTPIQFEIIPFATAILGVLSGILVLIPQKPGFWEHLIEHLPLKIATLVGAVFRLVDLIFICFSTTVTGDGIHYFRSRLQECSA